jgi:uncharacterized protein DUF2490
MLIANTYNGRAVHRTILMILTIIMFVFLASGAANAKKSERTSEVWLGWENTFKIVDDLDFEFGQDIRYVSSEEQLKNYITDIGLKYSIFSFMDFGVNYRSRFVYGIPQDEYMLNLNLTGEIDRFKIGYRLRYHARYIDNKENKYHIRSKFKFEYDIKGTPLSPFYQIEYYYRIDYSEADRMDKFRLHFGLDYKINKDFSFDVKYIYEEEINQEKPDITGIWAFGLSYKP